MKRRGRHEIKHDGFRIIAIRDGARVRLLTRKGIDLARRFAQIAAAVAVLPVRSCIIDGEAIACDANGLAVFELLRYRRACALGCEGIVSKRLGSPYHAGRAGCWIKVKNPAAAAVKRDAQENWSK
jgi:ATP-dependent DNA ligase